MATEDVSFSLGFKGGPAARQLKKFHEDVERDNQKFVKKLTGFFSAFGVGATILRAWRQAVEDATKVIDGQAKAAAQGEEALRRYNAQMRTTLSDAFLIKGTAGAFDQFKNIGKSIVDGFIAGIGGLREIVQERIFGDFTGSRERASAIEAARQTARGADAKRERLARETEAERIRQQVQEEEQSIDKLITEQQRKREADPSYFATAPDFLTRTGSFAPNARSRMQAAIEANKMRVRLNREAFLMDRLRAQHAIGRSLGPETGGALDTVAKIMIENRRTVDQINEMMRGFGVAVRVVNADD